MKEPVHWDSKGNMEMEDDPFLDSNESHEGSTDLNVNGSVSRVSMSRLFSAIHSGNTQEVENILNETEESIDNSGYGGLTPLHSACHMQQMDILKILIARGAKINVHDSLGNSALHVAVKEIWHDGVKELLEQGASPNEMSQPPKGTKGMMRETPLHAAVRICDKVSTSLLMEYQPDLNLRDGNNDTVLHLAVSKMNILILKEILLDINIASYMKNLDKNGHSIYFAAFSKGHGSPSENQILKVIRCIHRFHNNLDQVNSCGETPLIRACHLGLPSIVKFFLDNGADPTQVTFERQSAIHAACISGNSNSLRHLLATGCVGHLISSKDNFGNHPFYYASEYSSLECCKLLLENGEHLGNRYKDNISNCRLVIRHLPTAMELFHDIFNSGIKLSNEPKHHPDYRITFDYSCLISSEKSNVQCSIIADLIHTPFETLVKHPLVESFLYIKWCRIRGMFFLKVFQYFIYLLIHTIFVLKTFGTDPEDWSEDEYSLMLFRIFHGVLLIVIAVPSIIETFANFKKNLCHWETYTKLAALTSSIIVLCTVSGKIEDDVTSNRKDAYVSTERMFASLSLVLGWVQLMMLFGRLPTLGSYIMMVTKVGKDIFKFLIAFLTVLIGFTFCFHILFQRLKIFADINSAL